MAGVEQFNPPVNPLDYLQAPIEHERGFLVAAGQSEPYVNGLPPDDMWVVDREDCLSSIETPLDERGLIDVEALISVCKEVISPDYRWPLNRSRHHLYWTGQAYADYEKENPGSNAVIFRNLPINVGLLPRQFENVIHYVTKPSPIPDPEVMRLQIESWAIARSLFSNVAGVVRLERRARNRARLVSENPSILKPEFNGEDKIGNEYIAERFKHHFKGIDRHFDALESIPDDFRLVERDESHADLAKYLGAIIKNNSVPLVSRVLAA